MSRSPWNAFEHKIRKLMVDAGLAERRQFVLAVSGGLDSMAMLHCLPRICPDAQFKVLHFHHGRSSLPELEVYRESCLNLVSDVVEKTNETILNTSRRLTFIFQKSEKSLLSEEDFREARWAFIREHSDPDEVVVTAHHLDDRLETLLLKLIRGTGLDGATGFKLWNGEVFRPFFTAKKTELLAYAEEKKLNWIDDPTNADPAYLRNWLREVWLKNLEERVPGAKFNLAKSLYQIVESQTESLDFERFFDENNEKNALNRLWFGLLSRNEQLRALALFLRRQSMFDFTTGQLEEIRKRLDKNQKDLTFELLNRKWVINATQVMLQ